MKNWRFGDFVWILEHLLAPGLRGKVAPSAKKSRRAKKPDARPGVRNGTTNDMHGKTYVYSEVKTKPNKIQLTYRFVLTITGTCAHYWL